MNTTKIVKRAHGKKEIELYRNNGGISISFMKNGWQADIVTIDNEMLDMLSDVIDDYRKSEK